VAKIFSLQQQRNNQNVAIIRSLRNTLQVGDQAFLLEDLNPSIRRFNEFWELMETIKKHGYIRAAMSVVGRSAVGAWWTLRRHAEYGKNAPDLHRKRLFNFYMMRSRQWDNIKDFQNVAFKLMIGIMYLRYFGQAAYEIIRDENTDLPLGLDFLPGLVLPNVDANGKFKSDGPAFIQYPTNNPSYRVEFASPRDLVYLVNPDWEGEPSGGTDIEALSTYTLPLDIYLLGAARDYMKNRDKPEVVYELAPDVSDEGFEAFVKEMQARHAGPSNMGRNPIAVQGEFKVHELRPLPDALPYQESRKETREEELAVAGVSGAKLGISEQMASANLREMRREFHETSLVPLFTLMEIGFFEQIHQREFGMDGWEFKFNRPDFLNAVEKATVHMRYRAMGVQNANEIRYDIGLPARTDPGGDAYIEPKGSSGAEPGSPPEGRPVEPDDPSQTGEPTNDNQDPPRGDQHDDNTRENVIAELQQWKRFAIKRMKAGKRMREFYTVYIPRKIANILQGYVDNVSTHEELSELFDIAIEEVESNG